MPEMTSNEPGGISKDAPPTPAGETAAPKSRIYIVDDHTMLREGLRQLIERESNLTVCGDAPDAAEALPVD